MSWSDLNKHSDPVEDCWCLNTHARGLHESDVRHRRCMSCDYCNGTATQPINLTNGVQTEIAGDAATHNMGDN